MSAVLVVNVGHHRCGLPIDTVIALHRMVAIEPLPHAPDVVTGVINVHGEVVAVVDLRRRFGLPSRLADPDGHLVIVRTAERAIALVVDRAADLQQIQPATAVAPSDLLAEHHLAGVAQLEDGLILIHDVETFLSTEEAASLGHALSQKIGAGSR